MKIALIYSKHSEHTAGVAEMIKKEMADKEYTEVNVEDASFDEILNYDFLILGTSTWFDGELPNYWDEYLPGLEDFDFSGKKLALFGLGNQADFPENYQDAIGLLANFFESRGASVIGQTSIEGYEFENSAAVKNNKFCGLAIDSSFDEKTKAALVAIWIQQIFQ